MMKTSTFQFKQEQQKPLTQLQLKQKQEKIENINIIKAYLCQNKQDQHSKLIKAIQSLCSKKEKLKLHHLKGSKECFICEEAESFLEPKNEEKDIPQEEKVKEEAPLAEEEQQIKEIDITDKQAEINEEVKIQEENAEINQEQAEINEEQVEIKEEQVEDLQHEENWEIIKNIEEQEQAAEIQEQPKEIQKEDEVQKLKQERILAKQKERREKLLTYKECLCDTLGCFQTYHLECAKNELEKQVEEISNSIKEAKTKEELPLDIKIEFVCRSCKNTPKLENSLIQFEKTSIQELNQMNKEQEDYLQKNLIHNKLEQSKCGLCKFQWLKKSEERRIAELKMEDEKIYKEVVNKNSKVRIVKCKHIFCKKCLIFYICKDISQGNIIVECPQVGCEQTISYTEIYHIISTKFSWFLKYKSLLLAESLKKLKDKIQFVICPGLYTKMQDNCDTKKIADETIKIKIKKEIMNLRTNGSVDLSKLESLKAPNKEIIIQCSRMYQVNLEEVDMKKHFEEEINAMDDEFQKQEMKKCFKQYTEAVIIFKNSQETKNNQFMMNCSNESCQFKFCLNGCTEHPGNKCPFETTSNVNNQAIASIDRLFKQIGSYELFYVDKNDQIIADQSKMCFKCFKKLQFGDNKKETDQFDSETFKKCDCPEEFNDPPKQEIELPPPQQENQILLQEEQNEVPPLDERQVENEEEGQDEEEQDEEEQAEDEN